jgi:hypothetical protein
MRRFIPALIAIGAVASLGSVPSANAADCITAGSWAGWGQDGVKSFAVDSGQTCQLGLGTPGEILSSEVTELPKHGTLTKTSGASVEYTATAGYRGPDSFIIRGSGKDLTMGGVSTVRFDVTVR